MSELTRKWLPSKYMDETIPPPRESPQAWIISLPGDAFALDREWDDGQEPHILRDGDVVEFDWTVDLGWATLHIVDREQWHLDIGDAPTAPDGASLCILGDGEIDTLSFDMASFVENHFHNGGDIDAIYDVHFYAWSDTPVRFEYRAGAFHPEASS